MIDRGRYPDTPGSVRSEWYSRRPLKIFINDPGLNVVQNKICDGCPIGPNGTMVCGGAQSDGQLLLSPLVSEEALRASGISFWGLVASIKPHRDRFINAYYIDLQALKDLMSKANCRRVQNWDKVRLFDNQ